MSFAPSAAAAGQTPAETQADAPARPVTAEVRALLAKLPDRPVDEQAEVFAAIHGVLQNALSDAGRDPAPH